MRTLITLRVNGEPHELAVPVHKTLLEKFNGVAFGKKLCGSIASSGQTRRSRDTDNLILSMNDRTLRDARPSFG